MSRGSCPTDSGDPDEVENNNPDATTHFSKIRVGAPYCIVLYCTVLYLFAVLCSADRLPRLHLPRRRRPHHHPQADHPWARSHHHHHGHHYHITTTTPPHVLTVLLQINSNCPGGSLDVCISLCPEDPSDLFQNCVNQCMADCQ